MTADRLAGRASRPQDLGRRLRRGRERAPTARSPTILRGMGALMLLPVRRGRAARPGGVRRDPRAARRPARGDGHGDRFARHVPVGRRRPPRVLWTAPSTAAREAGALQDLDTLLWVTSLAELWGGTVRRATESVEQVREVRRAMGYDAENVINAAVMAWTGLPARGRARHRRRGATRSGSVASGVAARAALATRDLAEGQYGDAYDRLRPLVEDPFLHVGPSYFPDFVEAAARSDRPDARRSERSRSSRPWRTPTARPGAAAWRCAPGRWSARRTRPRSASSPRSRCWRARPRGSSWRGRTSCTASGCAGRGGAPTRASQLRTARDLFARTGADMFLPADPGGAGRDRRRASGRDRQVPRTTSPPRSCRSRGSPPPGRRTPRSARQLFISPNTVDYHLRKVFQKLGDLLPPPARGAPGARLTRPTDYEVHVVRGPLPAARRSEASRAKEAPMPRVIADDGAQIFYKDWGTDGSPVILSHGWPLNSDAWEATALFLAENGHRAIAHDRRGHGRSSQTWHGNEMDTYADDLACLIEKLDLSDLTLVGHSTGGGEIVHYVGRHGTARVAKLVLVGAVPPLMLQTDDNPEGLPIDVFDGIRAGEARQPVPALPRPGRRPVLRPQPARRRGPGLPGRVLAAEHGVRPPRGVRVHRRVLGHRLPPRPRRRSTSPPWSSTATTTRSSRSRSAASAPPSSSTAPCSRSTRAAATRLPDTDRDRLHADLLAFIDALTAHHNPRRPTMTDRTRHRSSSSTASG